MHVNGYVGYHHVRAILCSDIASAVPKQMTHLALLREHTHPRVYPDPSWTPPAQRTPA